MKYCTFRHNFIYINYIISKYIISSYYFTYVYKKYVYYICIQKYIFHIIYICKTQKYNDYFLH